MTSSLDGPGARAMTAILIALAAGAGCGSSPQKTTVSCAQSIAAYCAQNGCFATWADAQAVAATCPGNTVPYTTLSCGSYQALDQFFGDGDNAAYYDVASGQLVAIGGFSANTGAWYCDAGPTGGVAFPACDRPDAAAALDCGAPDTIVR